MLMRAGLTRAEYDERLRQERATWAADQYGGDHAARRSLHAQRWVEFFSMLNMTPDVGTCERVTRVLVVGCGLGAHEYDACRQFPNATIDALDLAEPTAEPTAWTDARSAFPGRIAYHAGMDVQKDQPGSGYEVIVALSVLHHCPFIEEAWANIYDMLTPGGIVMVSEYIGGRGLQAEPLRDRVAARLWDVLPVSYKTHADGRVQIPRTGYSAAAAIGFESICSPRLRGAAMRAGFAMIAERVLHPLSAYRLIPLGQRTQAASNPEIDRVIEAFEEILMSEGWLSGEDWYALLGRAK